jgi:hypothetical protein
MDPAIVDMVEALTGPDDRTGRDDLSVGRSP